MLALVAAIIASIVAGYYTVYQLFSIDAGLDDIAYDRADSWSTEFKYPDVKWFRGLTVPAVSSQVSLDGDMTTVETQTTRGLSDADVDLEIFAKLVGGLEKVGDASTKIGKLNVVHKWKDKKKVESFPLTHERFQRFEIEWPNYSAKGWSERDLGRTTTSFQLVVPEGSPVEAALVGTRMQVGLGAEIAAASGAAILLFGVWWLSSGRRKAVVPLTVIVVAVLVLAIFRGGAFISNDFFLDVSGEASVFTTAFGHVRKHERSDEWYPHTYKRAGTHAIPKAVMMVEPSSVGMSTDYYVNTWPTPRYLWFVLEALGLVILVRALHRYVQPAVGYLYPFIHVTFVPFLFNLYNMEGDAILTLLMMPLVAGIIKVAGRKVVDKADYVILGAIVTLMVLCKITAAFLALLIPLGLFAEALRTRHGAIRLGQASMMAIVLVGAVLVGNWLNTVVPPEKGEAQPGYAYQAHPLWDILWAANGLYDHDNAHGFVKIGRIRDRKVADAAGIEGSSDSRMRHAAVGDEEVYLPDLWDAWVARPSFFLNNAVARFWSHGLLFYGYDSRGNYWRLDRTSETLTAIGENEFREDDGVGNNGLRTLVERARFDPVWKIAPQVLAVSLFNFDQNQDRTINLLLTALAIFGVVLLRSYVLLVPFIGGALVKIGFNTFIHGKVRYLDFTHVPMLIGLTVLIVCIGVAILRAGQRNENSNETVR